MPPTTPVQKLIQLPLCRGLSEEQARTILQVCEENTVRKGETVFSEGDAGDGLYVVLEGAVEILKKDKGGQNQQLAKLGDGSVLGEMSLLTGDAPRSASAVATSEAKLLKLSSARFLKLLGEDHLGALKIVHNLAQVMSRRLNLMSEKFVELSEKTKRKEELADFQRILNEWAF